MLFGLLVGFLLIISMAANIYLLCKLRIELEKGKIYVRQLEARRRNPEPFNYERMRSESGEIPVSVQVAGSELTMLSLKGG